MTKTKKKNIASDMKITWDSTIIWHAKNKTKNEKTKKMIKELLKRDENEIMNKSNLDAQCMAQFDDNHIFILVLTMKTVSNRM